MTAEMAANMFRIRREQTRWFLLVALNVSRPVGAPIEVLLSVVQATYPDSTAQEIRRELVYLEDRALVKIERDPRDHWHCDLTRHGVDLAEYTVPVEPGIARPNYHAG